MAWALLVEDCLAHPFRDTKHNESRLVLSLSPSPWLCNGTWADTWRAVQDAQKQTTHANHDLFAAASTLSLDSSLTSRYPALRNLKLNSSRITNYLSWALKCMPSMIPMRESMLHVDERCRGLKKAEVGDKKQVLLTMTSTQLSGADSDQPYPRVTIDALPDDVLIETFEFYLGKDDPDVFVFTDDHDYDGWQTLVHVCRRWRCIVFASPRRLDLKLYCTRQRSVNSKTLNIWPALPIVIVAQDIQPQEDVTNIIAALRHHNRVCKIYCDPIQNSLLEEFAAIDEPFPALTSLRLLSLAQDVLVLPDSFLGGSAPRLQSVDLAGIPYPSIGRLLSSTTNLVSLTLLSIPHSGYFSPETIVPCLSMLPSLGSLILGFRYPRSQAHRANRHPPPLTRVVFPGLTFLRFGGDIEYLEDILSQIETPMLNESYFWLFNQLVFDTPLLGYFIRRTETFITTHTARVIFSSRYVMVILWGQEEMANNDVETLSFSISCKPLDWQLSALPQVLNSFLSSLSTLDSLEIEVPHEDWEGEIEVIQWQEFLHPFTAVKEMTLKDEASVRLVAPALRELARERATEVLPALQDLSLTTSGWSPSGPLKEAIEQFIATRRLDGHPVTVHYEDVENKEE